MIYMACEIPNCKEPGKWRDPCPCWSGNPEGKHGSSLCDTHYKEVIRRFPKTFRENPVCPCGDYPWHSYYWRRPREEADFDAEYSGVVTDPDGTPRNVLEERERRIQDQKAEIDFINSLKPGRILDVGCGPGFALSAINDEWDKYGTEISRTALKYAVKHGEIHLGELKFTTFVSGFFDVVLMQHVLRYVKNPVDYVRIIKIILKPGGHFIIAEADYDSGCARRFGRNYRLLHDQRAQNLFTSFSLVKLLEDTGFTILKVQYPFFETRWFTEENLLRLFDTDKVSPPFYGNFVTVYARKEGRA